MADLLLLVPSIVRMARVSAYAFNGRATQVLALVDSEGREVMVADDDEDEQDGVRCTNTGSKQPRRRGAEAAWSTAVTDLFEFPSEQVCTIHACRASRH